MTRTAPAPAPAAAPVRPAGPAGPGFGRGPMATMGMPAAKAMSFGPSMRRLLGRLSPEQIPVLAAAERLVVTAWRGVVVTDCSGVVHKVSLSTGPPASGP